MLLLLQEIPAEIFELTQLETLKLRNNPITEMPPQIGHLKQLRTLVVSFCLITALPQQYVINHVTLSARQH